jgi:hypothetical protein
MKIKREEILKTLAERFSTFSKVVTIENKTGYNDINKSAERLFMDILNITYKLTLRDMNDIQDNYPAIDLGDYNQRVCIQVTSESTNQKFKKTLEKFKEKQLDRDFNKIVFLIISNKRKCTLTDRDIKTEVINLNDVFIAISKLDDRDVFYINDYINRNLASRIEPSDSILPSNIFPSYRTSTPNAFIKFLDLENEPDLKQELLNDLKSFSQMLTTLTKHQREFIFYIMLMGQFPKNSYGRDSEHTVMITTAELNQVFGNIGHQIYHVLKSKNIVWLNDEYEPDNDGRCIQVMELYYRGELEDGNLFSYIKSFCKNDSNKLQRIFVDCDFSCLA